MDILDLLFKLLIRHETKEEGRPTWLIYKS